MEILLIEGAVTAATALASGAGGRVLWVRSRDHHQRSAIAACRAADGIYLTFSSVLTDVRLAIDTLLYQLGPQDSAAFQKQADKVLPAAEKLGNDYASFAYQEGGGNDPDTKQKRRTYAHLARSYADYERKLLKRQSELQTLTAECRQLQEHIQGLAAAHITAESAVADARQVLADRVSEDWAITSFQSDLEAAISALERAIGSMAASELITAIGKFAEARTQAAAVANAARELPHRQHALLRQAATFERQHSALNRDLQRAAAGLLAVQGVYAETAFSTEAHDLTGTRLLHEQLPALIAGVREDAKPQADAWSEAEAGIAQITETIARITETCKSLIDLRPKLDGQMTQVRADAIRLRGAIMDASMKTRDRDGDQERIRKAFNRMDAEVVLFIRMLDEPLPDPVRLGTRLNELKDLVFRLKRASKQVDEDAWDNDDEDGDDGVFGTIVAGAAAAVGIDLLID